MRKDSKLHRLNHRRRLQASASDPGESVRRRHPLRRIRLLEPVDVVGEGAVVAIRLQQKDGEELENRDPMPSMRRKDDFAEKTARGDDSVVLLMWFISCSGASSVSLWFPNIDFHTKLSKSTHFNHLD